MTVITDIPQSGLYFQRGAIIQLVVQLIDDNTGLPIPLQSATNLFIDILYPDRTGWRTFTASLYTDGSDGRIAYITANDGFGYSEPNQTGLYQMQGRVTIGVPLPASLPTDFYIQDNMSDLATMPPNYPVLQSPGGFFYQVFILQSSNLDTIPVSSPVNAMSVMYMRDITGALWALTVLDGGQLKTVPFTGPADAINQIYMVDSTKKQWVITVLQPRGNLKTT